MKLTPKQKRMLAETEGFHFDSGGDNADNYRQAYELEAAGLLTIHVTEFSQSAVYNCTPTTAGRAALAAAPQ